MADSVNAQARCAENLPHRSHDNLRKRWGWLGPSERSENQRLRTALNVDLEPGREYAKQFGGDNAQVAVDGGSLIINREAKARSLPTRLRLRYALQSRSVVWSVSNAMVDYRQTD